MDPKDLTIEERLAYASTLPSRLYRDPELLVREQERVFARTWQLVGRLEQARLPGDFFTCDVAGEPLVVTRAEDGALHAFSAVCRHRAGPVARGAGHRKSLQCAYHGWTYGLDGGLLSAPEFEGVLGFEGAGTRLPAFRVEAWGPFLFVTLDEATRPLAEVLGAIPDETRRLPLERMVLCKKVDYEVACNWKVYIDNYLEGYHIPMIHPELFRLLDYKAYAVETFLHHSKQHAPIRPRGEDDPYGRAAARDAGAEALYYWVFPNLMLNFYPDNLQTNVIVPLGLERTAARFEWYALDPEGPGAAEELTRSFAFSDQVQKQDMAICEAVQRGLRSRTYDRGRFSVLRENGVHHFHRLLAAFLA